MPPNQNPEQSARDRIDVMLAECGWVVQDKKAIDFNAGPGIAVREYQTDIGTADYALFFDNKPAAKDPWTKAIWYYDYRSGRVIEHCGRHG